VRQNRKPTPAPRTAGTRSGKEEHQHSTDGKTFSGAPSAFQPRLPMLLGQNALSNAGASVLSQPKSYANVWKHGSWEPIHSWTLLLGSYTLGFNGMLTRYPNTNQNILQTVSEEVQKYHAVLPTLVYMLLSSGKWHHKKSIY